MRETVQAVVTNTASPRALTRSGSAAAAASAAAATAAVAPRQPRLSTEPAFGFRGTRSPVGVGGKRRRLDDTLLPASPLPPAAAVDDEPPLLPPAAGAGPVGGPGIGVRPGGGAAALCSPR